MRIFAFLILFVFAAGQPGFASTLDVQAKDRDLGVMLPKATPKTEQLSSDLPIDLDGLFHTLKRTRNKTRAKTIEKRIWSRWQVSDNQTIDLLTHWARSATRKQQFSAALDLLDQVVTLKPEYAEGWNQRATLHFIMKNYVKSIADIERTLILEPRHFGALGGLANIQGLLGRDKDALATWYRALNIYPAMQGAQNAVIRLEEKLAGSSL